MEVVQLGNIMPGSNRKNPNQGRVYDKNCLAPTLTNMQGGHRQPMIIENVIIGGMQENQAVKKDGICTTLTSSMGTGGGYVPMMIEKQPYRIRKLTPKECWRLMDFTDEDFHKAEAVNSNTQLYKQAGNSIVVSVLEAIFRQLCIQNIPTWNDEKKIS